MPPSQSEPGNTSLPFVSCVCVTFARPELLAEAIECFLRQNYQGQKELVILNDFDEQTIVFDHPEVHVFNISRKFCSLGEKRNAATALARGEVIFPWDDDDIYLPFRLTQSANQLAALNRPYYKPKTAFYWNSGTINELSANSFHAQSCYTKQLFDDIGGYPPIGAGEDIAFDTKVHQLLAHDISTPEPIERNYYIYRWGGTDSYHLSALDQSSGEKDVYIQYKAAAKLKLVKTGEIGIESQWHQDYVELVENFITTTT